MDGHKVQEYLQTEGKEVRERQSQDETSWPARSCGGSGGALQSFLDSAHRNGVASGPPTAYPTALTSPRLLALVPSPPVESHSRGSGTGNSSSKFCCSIHASLPAFWPAKYFIPGIAGQLLESLQPTASQAQLSVTFMACLADANKWAIRLLTNAVRAEDEDA